MLESQSLPASTAGIALAAAERAGARPQPASSPAGQRVVLVLIALATASVCGWAFFTSSGNQQLTSVLSVLGGGCLISIVTRVAFRRAEKAWLTRLKQHTTDMEVLLSTLRTQLVEKTTIETHLLATREEAQTQVATLSKSNAELLDELNRLKQAEKSLSRQRQELSRSKDVLELHVQARAQELQLLQRRYELILNSAGEGICGANVRGLITFANPTAARILGYEINDLLGKQEADLFAPPSQQGDAPSSPLGEVMLSRRDGTNFAAEFVRSPIQENERVVGHVVLFKDITERKQSEMSLAHKAAELARSNAELEQFAFVASHDLQEPLRKILAFGDRLKGKCDEAKLEAGRDYLERMQNAAARMQRLINDLLTFSRTISRTQQFTPTDLGAVVRDVLNDLEVTVEKGKAEVEVGELPTVEADPTQMRQLLQNLISNALKFQPPGGVPKVRVSARTVSRDSLAGHANVLAPNLSEPTEELCELSVQDNGIGFEEKYLDRIFAVFQRLHGRQEYEGTGIGLAVCRRIVDRHKGAITAKSKPGEGTTFIVTLRFRQTKAQEAHV